MNIKSFIVTQTISTSMVRGNNVIRWFFKKCASHPPLSVLFPLAFPSIIYQGNAGQPGRFCLGIRSHVSHLFLFFIHLKTQFVNRKFLWSWLSCFTKKIYKGYVGNCFSSPSQDVCVFHFFSSHFFSSSLFNIKTWWWCI